MITKTQKFFIFLTVLIVFSCVTKNNSIKEDFSLPSSLRAPSEIIEFICSSETSILDTNQIKVFIDSLRIDNLTVGANDSIRIANNYSHGLKTGRIINLKSQDGKEWIFVLQNSNSDKIDDQWQEVRNLMDRHSGIQFNNDGFLYLTVEGSSNSSLNATLRSSNSIVNVGIELPFKISGLNDNLSENQKEIYFNTLNKIELRLKRLQKVLVSENQFVYKTKMNQSLTSDERLFGFIELWTEIKYNFVSSDRLLKLNWDKILQDYLPKVKAEQSNLEYYHLLKKLCATLKDGHTQVYYPYYLSLALPPLELRYLDQNAYVVNIAKELESVLPIGSKILSVEGIEVNQYLESNIFPYISSSTEHILKEQGVRNLLSGPVNSTVKITFETFFKKKGEITIQRNLSLSNIAWVKPKSIHPQCEFKILEDHIAYISLNSFNSIDIVKSFEFYLDTISKSISLIIDLRNNGGGNSTYGYEILKYFSKKPFLTSTWATREHRPSFKAWGKPYQYRDDKELNEFELLAKQNRLGTSMYFGTPDTIIPNKKRILEIPLVVLIGSNTASAAEDFLIALDQLKIATTIGSVTSGSTGQPLTIKLPGGGSARICTKKDSYPDGREFVGFGIKPDIEIKETIESVLKDQDIVLESAVRYLNKK